MCDYYRQEVHVSYTSLPEETPNTSSPRKCVRIHVDDQDGICDFPTLPSPGKFLTLCQLIDVLKSGSQLDCVPLGVKNNVYFLISNIANVAKQKMKGRSDYVDDCGVWDSCKGSTVNSYVLLNSDGGSRVIYLKNTVYCTESRVGGKSKWLPLAPQPHGQNVMKLHRYYATLKGNASYKKRITCVSGGVFDGLSVVEYSGVYVDTTVLHSNAKNSTRAYVRSNPTVLEKIRGGKKQDTPRGVSNNG
ncbi:hypothetical protein Hamer_G019613 [Homarus americanus]|uniref:Uncharacterized protein n=1 Tax=Homarus americanus TaxID=6706 RepID=A0A8J5JU21_HOMAM|nr:hypothetical protein Hamer_G019613 [Homarus americanus]